MKKLVISFLLSCYSIGGVAQASGSELLSMIDRLISFVEIYTPANISLISNEKSPLVGQRNFQILLRDHSELRDHHSGYVLINPTPLHHTIQLRHDKLINFHLH